MPDWLNAFSLKLKDSSNILSVPLSQNDDDILNGLKSRLVAYKDSLGNIQMATMAVKPDSAYLKATKGNLNLKTYTGDILLFNKESVFMYGYVLVNGKIVGELNLIPINTNKKANTSPKTQAGLICEWVQGPNYISDGILTVVARKVCTLLMGSYPTRFFPSSENDFLPEESTGFLGGTNEDTELKTDCAGVLGGTAYRADCGCIGDTTGISECPVEITEMDLENATLVDNDTTKK